MIENFALLRYPAKMSTDSNLPAIENKLATMVVSSAEPSSGLAAAQPTTPSTSTKSKSKSCGDSPKCASRENSRPHSPNAQWKKCGRSGSPAAELEREGGEEAPFAKDSAGASGYSSPYSERATPPYLRWAKSLEDVLDDYEGMELFKQYLAEQKESHLLDFWYACKGFRKLDGKECDKIRKVAERLYADYVASRGVFYLFCLSSDIRSAIHTRLISSTMAVDQTMYDAAHKEVQEYLRGRHAQFVTSDEYVMYLQDIQIGGWDSPKCYSREVHSNNSSSSGDARRPSSTFLPTVHEDMEFEQDVELAAAKSNCGTVAGAVKAFAMSEMDNSDATWSNKSSTLPKSSVLQQNAFAVASDICATSEAGTSGVGNSAPKRRTVPATAPTGGSGQRLKPIGSLTRDTLEATFGQRLLGMKSSSRGIGPPHPYHTSYHPYLPTSAQDSELQSMSSDATTESGFSGANYQRKEHRIMQQHVEHNRHLASGQNIPRTIRTNLQAQNMTDKEFFLKVQDKLELVWRAQEREDKLNDCVKKLSEPENGYNDHRAALNNFYNEERNSRGQNDDAEAILEDYCSRVPDFKDSPKHSPLRSPGIIGAAGGRRRSPIAKSPIRAMMTSYPSAGQPPIMSFSHTSSRPIPGGTFVMSQSVIQPNRNRSGHVSAGNTLHRIAKHDSCVAVGATPAAGATPMAQSDKRTSGSVAKKPVLRCPPAASDTSGIYSGTSTEPSLVNSRQTPPSVQRGAEQHWFGERHFTEKNETDPNRHKLRSAVAAAPVSSSLSESKSHRSSSHRGNEKSTSMDKSRGQKAPPEDIAAQVFKNLPTHVRRSDQAGPPVSSSSPSGASGSVQEISVGIFLPNEDTPYLVRYPGSKITLKQFKPLVPRKGNFRYFFQDASDEFGTGHVQREIIDDQESLPLHESKLVARVVPCE